LYRLKGCGDLYSGFPIKSLESKDFPEGKEIRGCMFKHTCLRELYMSALIESKMKECGIEVANHPVGEKWRFFFVILVYLLLGWWEYENLKDSVGLEKVKRCCAIYKTEGEKRLGDHVVVGLERLLPQLYPNFSSSKLMNLFGEERKDEDSECGIFPTSMVVLIGDSLGPLLNLTQSDGHTLLKETVPTGILKMSEEMNDVWNDAVRRFEESMKGLNGGSRLSNYILRFC